jgi:hypothetical protein
LLRYEQFSRPDPVEYRPQYSISRVIANVAGVTALWWRTP